MKAMIAALLALPLSALASDATKYTDLVSKAKVSLTDAITAAQTKANGKAVSAELDTHKGTPVYEVEVLAGAKMFDVRIDAADGKVLEMKEDK